MPEKHQQLKTLVYKGARNKKLAITDTILDRISYELSVIEKQGVSDYFILYSRIIEICNELNLLRSYGRGSSASSIVNYCLDITKINPIDENLIFERFLSPQQKQLADIDIDIPTGYHKNVIEKLKQKYPEYNACFIAYPSRSESQDKEVIYNNTVFRKHACGIIITTEKLPDSTFFYEEQEFYPWLKDANDPFYINKIDILELEYLNRLQLIVNEIGEKYHPYKLPLNDKQVFNLYVSGDLDNIFQFEASSLKRILYQFKPNSIHDLCIINALFRPLMLDHIPTAINHKINSKERYCWSDIRVSEILKETYGIPCYQETFLRLSKEIGGVSFDEADVWRRKIMEDKSGKEAVAFGAIFANGCRTHSVLDEAEIASLTKLITRTFPIQFVKAHSLCYSIIGYWGAYYKTHFRKEFEMAFDKNITFQ